MKVAIVCLMVMLFAGDVIGVCTEAEECKEPNDYVEFGEERSCHEVKETVNGVVKTSWYMFRTQCAVKMHICYRKEAGIDAELTGGSSSFTMKMEQNRRTSILNQVSSVFSSAKDKIMPAANTGAQYCSDRKVMVVTQTETD